MLAGTTDNPSVGRTHYSTVDVDEALAFMWRRYFRCRPAVSRRDRSFRMSVAGHSAGPIRLDHIRFPMGLMAHCHPPGRLVFVVVGDGTVEVSTPRERMRAARGDAYLYPVGRKLSVGWDRIDARVLDLPLDPVAEVAAGRTGMARGALRFESMTPVSSAMNRFWRSTIGMVGRELAAPDSALAEPLIQSHTVTLLASAALGTFPNTAMHPTIHGPGFVAPAAVRRAIAFIDDNARRPLTVSDVAAAAGISARALQQAFRRSHGTTPTAYLRRVRLERAHHDLLAADPTEGDTVADIARRWGFLNQGRFTGEYRRAYGRSPVETLHG
ncbi:MAG TPA: AraC family transcriptional regulator [Pseudonocardia sp.]|jgi:AraC-like DNA-binding protein